MKSFNRCDLVVTAEGRTQVPLYNGNVQVGRMICGETATVLDGVPTQATGRIYVRLGTVTYWVNADDVELLVEGTYADSDSDAVNHPAHYTYAKEKLGGLEVIDILEAFFPDEPLLWQVGKYMLRAGHKGSLLEDLEKARWYLDRRIEQEKE